MSTVIPFQVVGWEPVETDAPADGGPTLSRVIVRKQFTGALDAESTATLLTCVAPGESDPGAGYIASERVVGTLDGRTGTFVLQHGGLGGAGTPMRSYGNVVPGSGTGELAGLAGTASFWQGPEGHTLTLDYTLGL